jgi:hypothetical protein
MKIPEFCLSYMAIIGGLASHLPRSPMTHLSWDEFGTRVLEGRVPRGTGRAAWRKGGQGFE